MFKRVMVAAVTAAWLTAICAAQTNTLPTTGNVGIGTTSPDLVFDVVGTSRFLLTPIGDTMSTLMNAGNLNDVLRINAPYGENTATVSNAGAAWGIRFIGTTDPSNGLSNTAKGPAIFAVSEDSSSGFNRANGLAFYTNTQDAAAAERVRISNSGNVGIRTTNPSQTLSVNGSISATSGTGGGGLYFRTAGSQNNTVISSALLMEGALSGNASSATPWGLNLVSTPWSWGEDPITYHGGFHDFRTIGGNAAEKDVLNINGGGIVFLPGSGTSIIFADNTQQTTAWTGVLCGGDYAESVGVSDDRAHYEPGDLIVVDSDSPGKFLKSADPYSTLVAGIYSTKPGVIGRRITDAAVAKDEIPMAMVGIVPAKVSAENGPVNAGDLLVASSTPGYAMKGTDHDKMTGAVVGKSLGVLQSGTGIINVLVTLQ